MKPLNDARPSLAEKTGSARRDLMQVTEMRNNDSKRGANVMSLFPAA
jgi:hypothetical protein